MRGLQDMMKKAQAMQKKVAEAEERLKTIEVEGVAGGNMVKVSLVGKVIKNVQIDPSLLTPDEKEILEDLIAAAVTDALKKFEERSKEERAQAMEGIQLPPNFQMPGL